MPKSRFQEALVLAYKNPNFLSIFGASKTTAKTLHARHRLLEKIIGTVAKGDNVSVIMTLIGGLSMTGGHTILVANSSRSFLTRKTENTVFATKMFTKSG